jgi:hypothetical protein
MTIMLLDDRLMGSGSVSDFFFTRPDQGGSGSPIGDGSGSATGSGTGSASGTGRNRRISAERDALGR